MRSGKSTTKFKSVTMQSIPSQNKLPLKSLVAALGSEESQLMGSAQQSPPQQKSILMKSFKQSTAKTQGDNGDGFLNLMGQVKFLKQQTIMQQNVISPMNLDQSRRNLIQDVVFPGQGGEEDDVDSGAHDGDTIYDTTTMNRSETRENNFWGTVGQGFKRLMVMPFKGFEYIMDGGTKSNKIFLKKMMLKNAGMTTKKYMDTSLVPDRKFDIWKERLRILGFWIQYIVMPIIVLFSSVLSLLNLFIWSYYRRGYLIDPQVPTYLFATDILLVICFTSEFIFNVIVSQDIDEIFDFENMLLVIYNFEIIWVLIYDSQTDFILLLHSFRSLRTTKLRYVSRLFRQYIEKFIIRLKSDDLIVENSNADEEGEMNRFILNELAGFAGGILFESSLLLALDASLNYNAFSLRSIPMNFDYINSAYFVVISFSTVGYGDIVPCTRQSRLAVCLMIIVNMTILTNLIGRLIDHIFMLSPYRQDFDFKDHVIIIGNLPEERIITFLEELIENDKVDREMSVMNQFRYGIKCVIVMNKEPDSRFVVEAQFLADRYDNEIVFLHDEIFSMESKAKVKCNMKEAKMVYAFSHDQGDEHLTYIQDQQLAIVSKLLKEDFPSLEVVLVLNSRFKHQIAKDEFYNDIIVVSQREIDETILAQTLECPGLGTCLQHLFTMQNKLVTDDIKKVAEKDDFLSAYFDNLQSEIYQIKLPDVFVGMTFRKLALILYHQNLNTDFQNLDYDKFNQDASYLGLQPLTLIGIETINDDNFASMQSEENIDDDENEPIVNRQSRLDSSNLKTPPNQEQISAFTSARKGSSSALEQTTKFKINIQSEVMRRVTVTRQTGETPPLHSISRVKSSETQEKPHKTQILINPQQYRIKKNDSIFVLCSDNRVAQNIQNIKSQDHPDFVKALKNLDVIDKTVGSSQLRKDTIEGLFELAYQNSYKTETKSQSWTQRQKMEMNYVNLLKGQNLPKLFQNHLIVFSRLDRFIGLMRVLSKITNRPIILYTEDPIELQVWSDVCNEFDEIYYVQGVFTSINHLSKLEIKTAKSVLISAGLIRDSEFPDAMGLCLAKILTDHFDFTDFVLELDEEDRLNNVSSNLQLKGFYIPLQLQQSFAQGSIHLKSMSISVLARLVFNQSWLRLFQDLILPKQKNKVNQNNKIRLLRVSMVAQEAFQFFGILQHAFMEMNPSFIAIAILKQRSTSKYVKIENFFDKNLYDKKEEEFLQSRFTPSQDKYLGREEFRKWFMMESGKHLGDRYVMTNPSFYTPIEQDDMIILIGDLPLQAESEIQLNLPSLGKSRFTNLKKKEPLGRKYAKPEMRQGLKGFMIGEISRRIQALENLEG